MPIKLDELFFEVSLKKGAGTDQAISTLAPGFDKTTKSASGATKSMGDFEKRTSSTTGVVGLLKSGLGKLVIAFGGLMILRRVIGAMASFETRIAEISTIAGGGEQQVEDLKNAILSMTRVVPQSPDELGAGAYQILSAGITDTADVLSVLEASSKAAVAGLTDAETAVNAVTTVLNAYSMEASEATRVSDILFKTVELGKLRFVDIAQNIGAAATSAALAGVSIEELTAGIAVMTQRGVFAAEAVSSLNRLFLTLTSQNTQQEAAFRRIGIQFNLATVRAKGFIGLLEEVNQLSEGQLESLSELFPNIRAARAAFVLAGDGLDDYKLALEKTLNSEGAAERAFNKMNATATNQAKILRNNVAATLDQIGFDLLPGVSAAMAWLSTKIAQLTQALKYFGSEAFVIWEKFKYFGAVASEQVDAAVAALLGSVRKVIDFVAVLARNTAELPIPGAKLVEPVAIAMERLSDSVGDLEQAQLRQLNADRVLTENRRKNIEYAKQARDEADQLTLSESTYGRTLLKRQQEQLENEERLRIARQLTQEELERQADLQEQLLRRFNEATLSTAELQVQVVKQMREEWIAAFGSISEEAEEKFKAIEEAAQQALRKEQAEKIAQDFTDALEKELEDLELQYAPIELTIADLDPEDSQQLEYINQLQDLLNAKREQTIQILQNARDEILAQLEAEEKTVEEEEALRKVLIKVTKQLLLLKGAAEGVEEAAGETADKWEELLKKAHLLRTAVDGLLEMADALGAVSDSTKEVIQGLEQAAEGAATFAASYASGNIPGMVSGAIGTVGGLIKTGQALFGESEAEKEQRRILKANTRAIEKLTEEVGNLGLDIKGVDFTQLETVIGRVIKDVQGRVPPPFITEVSRELLSRELQRVGLDFEDLKELAESLGVTFRKNKPTWEELLQLQEAMAQAEITQFAQTFVGQMEALRAEFELFNIEDPIQQLERLREVFSDPKFGSPALREALAGLDLNSPEGRAAARQAIEELFRQLQTGTLEPAGLGGLTGSEFLDALQEFEGILDQFGEEAGGTTQDVRQQVSITEVQANQLLAYQSTLVFRAEQQVDLLKQLLEKFGPAAELTYGGTTVQVGPQEPVVVEPEVTVEAPAVEVPPPEVTVEAVVTLTGEQVLDASKLLNLQSVLLEQAEEQTGLLGSLLDAMNQTGVAPPLLPLTAALEGGTTTANNVDYRIQVGPNEFTLSGDNPEGQAEEFVDLVSRKLGERLRDRGVLYGDLRI